MLPLETIVRAKCGLMGMCIYNIARKDYAEFITLCRERSMRNLQKSRQPFASLRDIRTCPMAGHGNRVFEYSQRVFKDFFFMKHPRLKEVAME